MRLTYRFSSKKASEKYQCTLPNTVESLDYSPVKISKESRGIAIDKVESTIRRIPDLVQHAIRRWDSESISYNQEKNIWLLKNVWIPFTREDIDITDGEFTDIYLQVANKKWVFRDINNY